LFQHEDYATKKVIYAAEGVSVAEQQKKRKCISFFYSAEDNPFNVCYLSANSIVGYI